MKDIFKGTIFTINFLKKVSLQLVFFRNQEWF